MSDYKPLHELILEGLEEGTVLECDDPLDETQYIWKNGNLMEKKSGVDFNPLNDKWRISTPPKKIEFEAVVVEDLDEGGELIALPNDIFEPGTKVRVTVEEKRP